MIWSLESWRYLRHEWRLLPRRPGFPFRELPKDSTSLRLLAVPSATAVMSSFFVVWFPLRGALG